MFPMAFEQKIFQICIKLRDLITTWQLVSCLLGLLLVLHLLTLQCVKDVLPKLNRFFLGNKSSLQKCSRRVQTLGFWFCKISPSEWRQQTSHWHLPYLFGPFSLKQAPTGRLQLEEGSQDWSCALPSVPLVRVMAATFAES